MTNHVFYVVGNFTIHSLKVSSYVVYSGRPCTILCKCLSRSSREGCWSSLGIVSVRSQQVNVLVQVLDLILFCVLCIDRYYLMYQGNMYMFLPACSSTEAYLYGSFLALVVWGILQTR